MHIAPLATMQKLAALGVMADIEQLENQASSIDATRPGQLPGHQRDVRGLGHAGVLQMREQGPTGG
jgi:hypothetical protein